MDAGGRTNQETESRIFQDGHDCKDAGGRATQEAKAEDKPKYYIQSYFHNRRWTDHRKNPQSSTPSSKNTTEIQSHTKGSNQPVKSSLRSTDPAKKQIKHYVANYRLKWLSISIQHEIDEIDQPLNAIRRLRIYYIPITSNVRIRSAPQPFMTVIILD